MENAKYTAEDSGREEAKGLVILSEKPFRIYRMNVSKPTFSRSHHYHDSYEIYYLYSGEREYFIKNKSYHIKRGDLVIISAYDIHSTSNFRDSGYDRALINFKQEYISDILGIIKDIDLFRIFDRDAHVIHLNFKEQSYMEQLLSFMLGEYGTDEPGGDILIKTSLVQLLLFIYRLSEKTEGESEANEALAHKTVLDVAAYINNNYSEELSLETISEKFFISKCYFSRIFKKGTGVSFTEYLNGVRIKEAKRMLEEGRLSILEVSYAVGYKSLTHFGRSFRRVVGINPAAYRRNSRG